ncbi:MAG: hypothetical protein Q4F07_08855, partial [Bacteroidales bacterium]|nr:hypothetical protein [Bacteroidales bacterium]
LAVRPDYVSLCGTPQIVPVYGCSALVRSGGCSAVCGLVASTPEKGSFSEKTNCKINFLF